MERYPNLFLIGAPSAGTDAMSAALAAHPAVFCPDPAQPFHHCRDLPELAARHGLSDDEDYLALFADAGPDHRVVMEASAAYLASRIAVERIEAATARTAVYLVMLREPGDLVAALHRARVDAGEAVDASLARAWDRDGAAPAAPSAGLPDYRTMARLGDHTERLLAQVPRRRVLFVDHDRFEAEPAAVVAEVLAWLELPDAPIEVSADLLARDQVTGDEATRARIRAELRRDVDYLELLTGLDLSAWLDRPSVAADAA